VSADGLTWTLVGETTLDIDSGALVGLAVCSVAPGVLNTANFDNVSVTVPVPSPWTNQDIGVVDVDGSATSLGSGREFLVLGGGNIWDTSDRFHFVYQPFSGDVTIVAKVLQRFEFTSTFAKGGLMIRASTAPDAAHVILDFRPNDQVEFMRRPASGLETTFLATEFEPEPHWLRLVRTGSTITGWISGDGSTWRQVGGETTLDLQGSALVGLAVSSDTPRQVNVAAFLEVTVTAGAPAP
jgi:regulation of enolase protein 1 (concanavalin A-like superfamily)